MFITPNQLKAARALCGDMSQQELADLSGVSYNSIQLFEAGKTKLQEKSTVKILKTFDRQRVLFTARGGVEPNDNPVITIGGQNAEECYLELLNDVYQTLRDQDDRELLIRCADDSVSPPTVNERYRKMRAAGISMRQLVEQGNTYLMGPLSEYRYIPKDYFTNRVTLIYGGRVATVTANETKASINDASVNADTERKIFNYLWSIGEVPTKSTACETF